MRPDKLKTRIFLDGGDPQGHPFRQWNPCDMIKREDL